MTAATGVDRDSTGTEYQIRVEGYLSTRRLDAYGKLAVAHDDDGHTVISGPVKDQAALRGLLNWLMDLGLTLVSVIRLEGDGE